MIAMRKYVTTALCLMGAVVAAYSQEVAAVEETSNILRTDTIYRTDTIHVKEVITRTDIIQRTEQVVRYYNDRPFEDEGLAGGQLSNGAEQMSSRPGGKLVWVPDSMSDKVSDVLNGGLIAEEVVIDLDNKPVDLKERVLFRGDTINMVLKDRNLGRYDRGLFNYLFIPKGIWQIGLTASYGEFSTENLQILDLVSDIDFKGKLWSIKPYFQYFLKSNISLGLRLGYTQGKASIGSFNVDIDEDMSFKLRDIYYKSNDYSASLTFTQYLGIARRGRFGVFNEVELALAGGNSDFNRPYNGQLRKTHTTQFQAALNFSPGVCVFVLDQISFNVSLGVFGLNIKHEKQKVDGEELGWRTTSGANFRFNLFNINFGIAINI